MTEDEKAGKSAFIWDLDGTLLDSYAVIVPSLHEACLEYGINIGQSEVLDEVISRTVGSFFNKIRNEYDVPMEDLINRYMEIKDRRMPEIRSIKNASEILRYLKDRHIPNYVFTHRGSSTAAVLKNTGLYDFFDEIVTGKDGFPRKPDPSAVNYLIEKYNLDRDNTYYVGDRTLDVECAENAGIRSILYLPEDSPAKPTGKETHIVRDLMEISRLIC